ncbi:uncharacterized protein [Primulina huaijiensis]|uniref:uncharacterized protein n=1 Tax=Primulina huaijiensis TaxID=1492673 RepID=UPI003CC7020D
MDLLKDYDCEIQYHPGKVNVIVDALSRKVVDVNLSSIHVSKLRDDICTSGLNFQIQDDSLRLNGRFVVPDIPELCTGILKEAHFTRYSIHPRGRKMYQTLRPQFCMYGKRCRSPFFWDEFVEKQLTGPEIVQEMHDKVQLICQRMKATQDRQVSYANRRRRPLEFQVGYFVFLRISLFRGVACFRMRGKLSPSFVGPYEIVERIGTCAYRLDLPQSLSGIHDIFHVSILRKYEPDPSHVIQPDEVELYPSLSYTEYPVCILDLKDKVLRNKVIPLVRVQWSRHEVEESTWETEEKMRASYPYLFDS